ncbi:MAG: VWA domain-containing protein [Haloarculaceae archaeon]
MAPTDDDVADRVTAAQETVRAELVRFVRSLRAAGADVPANAALVGARSLGEVGLGERERARVALRAAVVTREEDLALFDRLFPQFWSRLEETVSEESETPGDDERYGSTQSAPGTEEAPREAESADGEPVTSTAERRVAAEEADETDEEAVTAQYSPAGRAERVASEGAAVEDDRVAAATRRLSRAIASLPGRRDESTRSGDVPDARRALRQSYGTGGVVVSVPERERKRTAVRGVVLVDVSRSVLDVIDRDFLIGTLRALHAAWRSTRIFFFDADIREVTDAFEASSVERVYDALDRAEAEWGGGTRIGHAFATLRDEYPDAVDRRTAVFVVSDGLEMGDVAELEDAAVWLSGRAGTVLWLNPLAASSGYEPSCRGMAAALPYVDGLFAFTGPEDVEEVARQLEQRGPGGPLGYAHDGRGAGD